MFLGANMPSHDSFIDTIIPGLTQEKNKRLFVDLNFQCYTYIVISIHLT